MTYPPPIFSDEQIKNAGVAYKPRPITVPGDGGKDNEGWTINGPGIKEDHGPWWPGADGERFAVTFAAMLNVAYAYGDAKGLTAHGKITVQYPKRRRKGKNAKAKARKT